MTDKEKCGVPFCTRTVYAKGLCSLHYQKNRRTGNPYGVNSLELVGVNEKMLSLLHSMVETDEGWIHRYVGGGSVFQYCGYCDAGSTEEGEPIQHKEDCPILKAQAMFASAQEQKLS